MVPRAALLSILAIAAGCEGSIAGGGDAGSDAAALADARPEELPEGLTARYYASYRRLALERIEPTVDFAWGQGAPAEGVGADYFSVRFTGFLVVPETGTYSIAVSSDDGVRLWLDGELRLDEWRIRGVEENRIEVELEAGTVPIRLDYFEAHSPAEVHLSWIPPGGAAEIIPASMLRAAAAATDEPAPAGFYQNPVVPFDCPDPGVIDAGEGDHDFYVVCTGGSFPIRRSPDLVQWHDTGAEVLPGGKAPWSANGFRNWAPELHRVGETFVAYFTAVNGADVLSVGAASATEVLGPYTDRGGPMIEAGVGVIDATFFEDTDGRRYLFYKIDGNSQGQPTPMYVRELSADGLSFAPGSTAVEVLRNDPGTWEGGVVEAPWVVRRDGTYYLFYSGNVYDHRYRTGVARASSITGPYQKLGPPILGNNEAWVGPGHGTVLDLGGVDYFVYHAWVNAGDGSQGPGGRRILIDRIDWVDGWPRIGDGTPSRSPQPWPTPQR